MIEEDNKGLGAGEPEMVAEKHWARDLRNSFFAGLLVVAPVAAAVGIVLWLFTTFTDWLLPVSLSAGKWGFAYRVVALVLFVTLVALTGWLMRRVVGKQILAALEAAIDRVPVLNKTYGFMKQIGETVRTGQQSVFQRVVVVEYPRPGIYTLAFATTAVGGEAPVKTGRELVSVFLPTPPNPTTGYLALFPREQVVELEMSVADAMKMAFTGGAVVPPYPVEQA